MRDIVSTLRAKALHPKIAQEVGEVIDLVEKGFPPSVAVRITQGLRTFEQQDALYAQGRTVKGPKVTNAKGGASYHNYGLAFDFALLHDKDGNGVYEVISWDMNTDWDQDHIKDWAEVANTFIAHGYEWGGNWKSLKDNPHFQKTFGYTWQQLLIKYHNEDFIPHTKYVNL
jgi:peptidoglycan L-alanyl-D-glutamate endopeptidase CwlK